MAYLGQRTFASFEKESKGWGDFFEEDEELYSDFSKSQNFEPNSTLLNKKSDSGNKKERKRHINDPELTAMIIDSNDLISIVENYHEGAALVGKFGSDLGDFNIHIEFTVTQSVTVNDPEGKAFKDMLIQIFQMDEVRASEIVVSRLARMPNLWNKFPEVTYAPDKENVIASLNTYLGILFNDQLNLYTNAFTSYYLMIKAKSGINQENAKEVNYNLFILSLLPSEKSLLQEFQYYSEQNDAFIDKLKRKDEEITLDYNLPPPPAKDNTNYVVLQPQIQHLTLKEKIINFTKNRQQLSSILGDNVELINVVSQVLLSIIEDTELKKNTQTPAPELYESYLDFQEKTILESDLYEELQIARSVYSEYYLITQQILNSSSTYHEIIRISGESWSGPEGQAEYDAYFIWDKVLSKQINNSAFYALRNEYPDIPYGQYQFVKMYIGGAWTLSNRDIVEMLRNNFLFNIKHLSIEDLSKEKNDEDEISLIDQLSGMVMQLETISDAKHAVQTKLIGANYDGTDAIPLPAVLMPEFDHEQQAVQLSLYLVKVKPKEWKVIDFSIPSIKPPAYTGKGNDDKEAILNALIDFGQEATYPKGDIIAKGPKEYLGEENRIKVHSTGENWDQNMAGNLSMISAVAGILGLILVFTPLAPLGAGLLFVSGVTGAGAAGLRIKDRVEHETFELNAETMLDVVDIVTGFIVAGKVATTAFKVVNQASKGSRMAVLVQGIETGADVASVVLIGNQFLGELERIENDPSLSPEEKERLKSEILQQAAAAGLLMLVGYAAPKLNRRFGVTRNKSLQGPDPNWKSTQTGNTSKNSKILRDNLGLQKGDGKHAHHIVPSTSPHSLETRKVLDKYQIDVNSKENGVGITKNQHEKTGLHKEENINKINNRIKGAQEGIDNWGTAREAVLAELESIQSEILKGLFP